MVAWGTSVRAESIGFAWAVWFVYDCADGIVSWCIAWDALDSGPTSVVCPAGAHGAVLGGEIRARYATTRESGTHLTSFEGVDLGDGDSGDACDKRKYLGNIHDEICLYFLLSEGN